MLEEYYNLYYVVQGGDSLWKIAAIKLGNASMYGQIVSLNPTIFPNGDGNKVLNVGTSLTVCK